MPRSTPKRGRYARKSSRGSRAAAGVRKRRSTKTRAALAKVTARQAYKIAVKADLDMKEDKHFKSIADAGATFKKNSLNASCQVAVFCAGTISDSISDGDVGLNTITYGGSNISNMNMLRLFTNVDATKFSGYQADGNWVKPNGGTSTWRIERPPAPSGSVNLQEQEQGYGERTQQPDGIYQSLPMKLRVIRVTPIQARGISTKFNMDADLFLDQWGKEQGIASGAFTQVDLNWSKVNDRKYKCISDNTYTLHSPMQVSRSPFTVGQDSTPRAMPNYMPTGDKSGVTLKFHHQLTEKRGGRVHYKEPEIPFAPDAFGNPDSGSRREFIVMHAWYENTGGDNVLDPSPPGSEAVPPIKVPYSQNIEMPRGVCPQGTGQGTVDYDSRTNELKGLVRVVSTFKDV